MPIVFHPLFPDEDLSNLVTGAVMIISASVVIHRIYNKSKNDFAYTLMGLTLVQGVAYILYVSTDAFRMEVALPDGVHHF